MMNAARVFAAQLQMPELKEDDKLFASCAESLRMLVNLIREMTSLYSAWGTSHVILPRDPLMLNVFSVLIYEPASHSSCYRFTTGPFVPCAFGCDLGQTCYDNVEICHVVQSLYFLHTADIMLDSVHADSDIVEAMLESDSFLCVLLTRTF